MSAAHDRPAVTLEVDTDQVGWLVFDQPGSSVNVLSTPTMEQLDRLLSEAESRISTGKLVVVVVKSGKPGSFIAGADVREILALPNAREARDQAHQGQRIFHRLEMLRVPTVAVIDGTCLGGGTELVLACDYRIATDRGSTMIGLPETRLGILPGFGGSVRLPRLVGIQNALDIILPGKSVSSGRALRIGLVDRVIPYQRLDKAVAEALRAIRFENFQRRERRTTIFTRLLEGTPFGRKALFSIVRRRTLAETKGNYPAPLRAIEVIRKTYGMQLDRALDVEAEALGELAVSAESKNLVRVFLLQQAARKALPADQLEAGRPIEKVAVLGAGVMGGAIAEVVAARDVPVVMKDINQEALDAGLHHASDLLQKAASKRVFTPEEASLKFALIQGSLAYDGIADADLVIEAVIERMPVKQQVLRESEELIGEQTVFATNTSSLSVSELALAAKRPGRVVGLHFFNPVHKMPLVEVVRTELTTDEALATAFNFVLDLGKTPVMVADRPGFLVNRLLAPYLNEVGYLLDDGATVEAIDGALVKFGMPMGPCRLLDEIGFDVAEHVSREMEKAFGERMQPSGAVARLREDGRLGRKNGRGFYRYDRGRDKGVDPAIAEALPRASDGAAPDGEQIRQRCLYLMVNEAAFALAEEVVRGADDVDIAMIMGTGFPPFRGGLLRWADGEGLVAIVERLEQLTARGERFEPAPLLRSLAASGQSFTASG
jgi:3-hydroxyacyl-CoA dehydrogenase/enoyl-CoA hydratase/3-hydroxybutyryl-CoA epimerase